MKEVTSVTTLPCRSRPRNGFTFHSQSLQHIVTRSTTKNLQIAVPLLHARRQQKLAIVGAAKRRRRVLGARPSGIRGDCLRKLFMFGNVYVMTKSNKTIPRRVSKRTVGRTQQQESAWSCERWRPFGRCVVPRFLHPRQRRRWRATTTSGHRDAARYVRNNRPSFFAHLRHV